MSNPNQIDSRQNQIVQIDVSDKIVIVTPENVISSLGYVPENANNKIEVWSSQSNNINYPAEKLVKDSLDLKLDSSAYNAEDILSKLKTAP